MQVYGEGFEEKPIMRLSGKPEPAVLKKIIQQEKLSLPASMLITQGESTGDK